MRRTRALRGQGAWFGACVLLALGACSGDSQPRTSVGEGPADYFGDRSLPEWSLSEDALLVLTGGREPGEPEFFRIAGAVRHPSGGIVVANAGSRELLFYSDEGHFLRAVGGQGSGPGEFRGLDGIGRIPGDSIVAVDGALRRITVLDEAGGLGRTAPLPVDPTNYSLVGTFADGSLLLRSTLSMMPGPEPIRRPTLLVRYSLEGNVLDTIASVPGLPIYAIEVSGGQGLRAVPFGPDAHAAVSGQRAYVGMGDEPVVEVRDDSGRVRDRIRWDAPERQVSDADRRAHRDRTLAATPSRTIRRLRAREFDGGDVRFPPSYPAHASIEAGPGGEIWVEGYPRTGARARHWLIFDQDGRPMAHFALEARSELLAVGEAHLVLKAQDRMGTESVRVHGLVRER